MTKKYPGLPFHFHVIDLFKSWSNLGFDQDSNGHKHSEKIKKSKTKAHIVFLCHIVSIQKFFFERVACIQKLINKIWTYSNQTNHVSTPPNPKLCLMKSSMKRSAFGFQTWKFQKPPKSFILE